MRFIPQEEYGTYQAEYYEITKEIGEWNMNMMLSFEGFCIQREQGNNAESIAEELREMMNLYSI